MIINFKSLRNYKARAITRENADETARYDHVALRYLILPLPLFPDHLSLNQLIAGLGTTSLDLQLAIRVSIASFPEFGVHLGRSIIRD